MGKSAVKQSKKEIKSVKAKGSGKSSKKESKKVESSSESSSSSSESSSESEDEKKEESSSESSSESEEEKKEESSDSESSSSEEEKKDESSDSDSSDEEEEKKEASSSSSSDEEEDSKKRKADDESASESSEPETKKAKTEEEAEPATIFVGRLSWNIDDDWLKREFEHIGGVLSARVLTERATGRSKGYGYVDFESKELAEKAVADMNGKEVDGREINVDMSNYKKPTNGERSNDRAKQFRDTKSEPSDTLFIGNLSFDSNRDSVTEFFAEQGTILGVRLPTHPETEQPKGFGYVQFSSVDEAKAALEALNGEYLDNRPVRLDYSTPRPPQQDRGFNRGGDRGDRGGFNRGGDRGGRGGRGGFNRGGRGGFNRGGDRGSPRPSGSGANSTPVQFKGNKKTFD